MKRTRQYRTCFLECVALAVLLIGIVLVMLIHFNPGFTHYSSAVTPFFILQPDDVK